MESQHCSVPVLQVEPEEPPGVGEAKATAANAKTTASLENIVMSTKLIGVRRGVEVELERTR